MTSDDRQLLRDAALVALRATPPRSSVERVLDRWRLQTSNSFRRIGSRGDGDVLCGTKHPIDGHPDLLAAPGVLDYVVAAQPRVVLQFLDDVDALEDKLRKVEGVCGKLAGVESLLDQMSDVLFALRATDVESVVKVRALIDQLATSLREVQS